MSARHNVRVLQHISWTRAFLLAGRNARIPSVLLATEQTMPHQPWRCSCRAKNHVDTIPALPPCQSQCGKVSSNVYPVAWRILESVRHSGAGIQRCQNQQYDE